MTLSNSALLLTILAGSATAFKPAGNAQKQPTKPSSTTALPYLLVPTNEEKKILETSSVTPKRTSKKEERLRLMQSPQFHRGGFKEQRAGAINQVEQDFMSPWVKEMKSGTNYMEKEGVKVHLAQELGFCWGVERSIALAYEAVDHFPEKNVHITGEIIHNPIVNNKLRDLDIEFLEQLPGGKKDYGTIEDGDVVILPAFGASLEEMEMFDEKVRANPTMKSTKTLGRQGVSQRYCLVS